MSEIDEDVKCQIDSAVKLASDAQYVYGTYSQKKVDEIFTRVALKLLELRYSLARLAVEDSGFGRVEDKVLKNHAVVESCFSCYINQKTVGVVEENHATGTQKIAEPVGTICGVVPCTNPSATTAFYILLSLKTRNAVVFAPHPRTVKTTLETVRAAAETLKKIGAPSDLLQCITKVSVPGTQYLMSHPDIGLIVATGGNAMVHAAYSSGTPAIGVGAGNAPIIIDEGADLTRAISDVCLSKLFDHGVPCTSESNILFQKDIYDEGLKKFKERGGYVLPPEDVAKLKDIFQKNGSTNPAIVGMTAVSIAELAGFSVPPNAKILGCELTEVGDLEPLSHEKLSPILGFYRYNQFEDALDLATKLVDAGGKGHTAGLHTGGTVEEEHKRRFSEHMKCTNLLVNTPTTMGVVGSMYTFDGRPTMSKGCGTWGKNSTSGPLDLHHLLNYKLVQNRQSDMFWFRIPQNIIFGREATPHALKELQGYSKKVFLVTDRDLVRVGLVKRVTDILDLLEIKYSVFDDIIPDPDFDTVLRGVEAIKKYKPDTILAFGGGSPMDAAKIMRLLYECPEADCHLMTLRCLNMRRRTYRFPKLASNPNHKTRLVCIPTTSGTGSEVTPYAVVTDPVDKRKYPVGDYEILADMAVVDASLVQSMPSSLCAATGMDALTHSIETMVSPLVTEFTKGLGLQAVQMCLKYLPLSYDRGNPQFALAREKMHYAATIACMAVGQALVGLAHSMAHSLGSMFHIPHGVACSLCLPHVIAYNSCIAPTGAAAHSNLKDTRRTRKRYVNMAMDIGLTGDSDLEFVEKFIVVVEEVSQSVGMPKKISDLKISEEKFMSSVEQLCHMSFDDSCTLANPRLPMLSELNQLFLNCWKGEREILYDLPKDLKVMPVDFQDDLTLNSSYSSIAFPKKIYYRPACMSSAFEDIRNCQKVCVITNKRALRGGHFQMVSHSLQALGISYEVFSETERRITTNNIQRVLQFLQEARPSVIIGVGGTRVLDLAKLARVAYDFDDKVDWFSTRYRSVVHTPPVLPEIKRFHLTSLICIGTSLTMTGSVPFAFVRSESEQAVINMKELTPDTVILDAMILEKADHDEIAIGGLLVLAYAFESILNVKATDFSIGMAFEAIRLSVKYLKEACSELPSRKRMRAREKVQYASCMAGIVIGQTGVGLSRAFGNAIIAALPTVNYSRFVVRLLPHLIKFLCIDESSAKMVKAVAKRMRLADENALLEKIFQLHADLNVTDASFFEDVGLDLYRRSVNKLVFLALEDECMCNVIVKPDYVASKQIFLDLVQE